MHVEERGLIFDAEERPAAERIAFFPSLCPTAKSIFAAFQVGPAKHAPTSTVRLCRSRDAGSSWSELPFRPATVVGGVRGSLATAELVETRPGELLLFSTWLDRSDPSRPLFDPETEGILHSKQLCSTSKDDGVSWSPWRELPADGLTGCSTTGPVLRFADGTVAYAFESFKVFDDPGPAHHAAWVTVSKDRGRTFSPPVLVAEDPADRIYFWDQRLAVVDDHGAFVALFWTHDRGLRRDRNVHLRRGSIDDASAGTPPVETSLPGQIAAPLRLDDGRLLAFVVERELAATLTLWSSRDDGVSWPAQDRLIVHRHDERALVAERVDGIDFNEYWEEMGKWSFGHPVIRALDAQRVLLAFYAGRPDAMSIHWARVNVAGR